MARRVTLEDFYLEHKYFYTLAGMSQQELTGILRNNPECGGNEAGLPVFGVMRALMEEVRELSQTIGKNKIKFGSRDNDEVLKNTNLELELKYEKLIATRLANQVKLLQWIPKEEATNRVQNVFKSVMSLIQFAINDYSATKENPRQARVELTEAWNKATAKLEEESEIISWEEDGNTEILRTRLAKLHDKDYEEYV